MVRLAYVQLAGCCGCLVSLADTYERLLDILDEVELVYCQTLMDERKIPECDVAIVEGAVCLNYEECVEFAKQAEERSDTLVALGACAATGNFMRYSRGNEQSAPTHEAFVPLTEVADVDYAIPGCPPAPEAIERFLTLLLEGETDLLEPFAKLAEGKTEYCGCDLMYHVVNKNMCMGCGTCAAACPTRAIEIVDGRPVVNEDRCIKCGACFTQCPRTIWPGDDAIKELVMGGEEE
ncbi:MAG: coenzyme F420 hydrogenase subunit gamma [Euryarchaeota archaeon]